MVGTEGNLTGAARDVTRISVAVALTDLDMSISDDNVNGIDGVVTVSTIT